MAKKVKKTTTKRKRTTKRKTAEAADAVELSATEVEAETADGATEAESSTTKSSATKTKRTTKRTTKRKSATKKTTKKKSATKSAAAKANLADEADADEAAPASKSRAQSTSKTRAKSKTKRTRKTAAPSSVTAEASVDAEDVAAGPSREEHQDAVIIRFPPVAPSPFRATASDRAVEPAARHAASPLSEDIELDSAASAVATADEADASGDFWSPDDDDDASGATLVLDDDDGDDDGDADTAVLDDLDVASDDDEEDSDDATVSAFDDDEADDLDTPAATTLTVDDETDDEVEVEVESTSTSTDASEGDEASRPSRRRRRRRRRRGGRDRDADRDVDRDAQRDDRDADSESSDTDALDDDDTDTLEVADPDDDLDDSADAVEELDEASTDRDDERGRRPSRPSRRGRRGRRGRRSGSSDEVGSRERSGFAATDDDTSVSDEVAEYQEFESVDVGDAAPSSTKVNRTMLINFVPRDECRIAVLEDNRLEELYLERASYENHVGSIFKGVVTNVESGIQAAFVDFGLGKNGFLHVTDLHPQYFPDGSNEPESVGRKIPRRARPPIQRCLKRGQEVIVQITKEGIGTKGPTLSTYLSIPGRFLVMMPGMRRLGISRKIEEEDSRGDMRSALKQLELPKDIGFIARTAAAGKNVKELQNDLNYLERLWRAVERRAKREKAPAEVYRESDLIIRTIRDVYDSRVKKIVVDDPEVADRAREFLSIFNPRSGDIVVEHDTTEPLFHSYKIEGELEKLHSRRVPLKSGGSLVIDSTEALVAIDVNSGRFRAEDDAESTAFKINLEAADEIARQLRLRDLGGVVVCDFIDMRQERHKRKLERLLNENLQAHKERAKVLRMSQFGIIEITRQRQRASFTRNIYQDCPFCSGNGLVKTVESTVIDAVRMIQMAASKEHVAQIELTLAPEPANILQNRKRSVIYEMERSLRRSVTILSNPAYGPDRAQLKCFDQRGRIVPVE